MPEHSEAWKLVKELVEQIDPFWQGIDNVVCMVCQEESWDEVSVVHDQDCLIGRALNWLDEHEEDTNE